MLNFYTTFVKNDTLAPPFKYMYDMWAMIFDNCPKIKASCEKMCENPGVKMQLEMRPKSPF
jgi:hypothetical protein